MIAVVDLHAIGDQVLEHRLGLGMAIGAREHEAQLGVQEKRIQMQRGETGQLQGKRGAHGFDGHLRSERM